RFCAWAAAGGYATCQLGSSRFVRLPVQAIADDVFGSLGCGCVGHPHGKNVVAGSILGRTLDQLYCPLAPVAHGLDPGSRAAFIVSVVQVVVETAVALRQAEAAGILVQESREHGTGGIVQWAPDAFASLVPQRQAVRVVDLGAPVDVRRLVF